MVSLQVDAAPLYEGCQRFDLLFTARAQQYADVAMVGQSKIWRYFREWCEYKSTLMHARMRQGELRIVANGIAVQK